MIRPQLGSVAEELYARLEPFHNFSYQGRDVTDEEMGWALLVYWGTIARRWQEIDDISRDSDDGEGWTSILDIDRVPDKGIAWLGQFKGVLMPQGLTPDQQRARVKGTDGYERGTPAAIAVAAQRRLTGDKRVIVNERLGGDANQIGVITWTAETPEPDLTRLDIEEQLPWWIKLDYVVEDVWDYEGLKLAFDDYEAIRTHYDATGYLGIRDDNPPAT